MVLNDILEPYQHLLIVYTRWYSLMAARTYLELASETNLTIVDDSSTISGVWSKERIYPSLFAQISHPLFEYSFCPMSKDDISPDRFVSGKTIHNYFDSFARDHNLLPRLRLRTRVTRVARRPAASEGWILDIKGGKCLICDKLIYTTGANSSPIKYISSSVQRATIVGRSKSLYDAVYYLLCEVKKVMRNGLSGPSSLYAPTFLGLWNIADYILTRFASSFSLCIIIPNYLSVSHAEYWKMPNAEKFRPRLYSDGRVLVCWGSGGIGIATTPDFWKVFHRGDVTIYSTEIEYVVNLKNGYSVATDIYDAKVFSRWIVLDEKAERAVAELLPRFRRLVVPALAARDERLILFLEYIYSAFIPLAAEL
ncbi:LOW QUALITY PROTEIN: hypothetical protein BDP67DRAFT_550757 [Colletotrichum lupini]|nr:LOW QUALITY PROTEIN: hypothetical protein BDP67DRAFT_550757 [Colletotrichum lupini]